MGESTSGIEALRYIYFSGENGCVTNGPNCHLCMNEVFRSDGLQDVDHVFAVAQCGLVPFFIRSLVFLYGMDTPFSLKDIWEPYLATECLQCSIRRYLSLPGQEISQEITTKERKQIETDVIREVVESSVQSTCPDEGGSTEIAPTTTSSEMKRIIGSDDAEIYSKRLKIEREEEFEPAMTLCWGNIPNDDVQSIPLPPTLSEETSITEQEILGIETAPEQPVVPMNVKEEPREVEPASFNASHPEQQDSQTCSSSDMSIYPQYSHQELENEDMPPTSTLERTSELPHELFPFLRGRCPSTVADPIISWHELSPYLQSIKQEHFDDDALRGCIFYRYFKDRQFIKCSACSKTIDFREDGFYHILGKSHFMQVTKRNEVFSMYMDLRRLCALLCKAKMEFMGRGGKMYLVMQTAQFLMSIPNPSTLPRNTLPAELPIMKTVETVPAQTGRHGEILDEQDSNEEPRITKHAGLDGPSSTLQDSQTSTAHCITLSSEDEDDCVLRTGAQYIPGTGALEITTLKPEEWFPFMTGRCLSTVSDPISTFEQFRDLLVSVRGKLSSYMFEFMLRKRFPLEKQIFCPSCDKNICISGTGFEHFLSKRHFNSVLIKNKVFSLSMDCHKFKVLVKAARSEKHRVAASAVHYPGPIHIIAETSEVSNLSPRVRYRNCAPRVTFKNNKWPLVPLHNGQNGIPYTDTIQDGNVLPDVNPHQMERDTLADVHHENESSLYNNCVETDKNDFPFLQGRNREDVLDLFVLSSTMRKKIDVICSEVNENPNIRTLARQMYFHNKVSYFCSYCQQHVNTFNLLLHSLSSTHLKAVVATGKVFCKIRDYNKITSILHMLKQKQTDVFDRPLSPDCLLPFGHGKPAEYCTIFVSFQNIFDCLSALRITGRLDSEFYDFLLERYREVADVNVCPHCGPLGLEKNVTNISHFLSLNHIAKAMVHGKVFVNDVKILQSQFRSFLTKFKSRAADAILQAVADAILQAVEMAIENKTYSNDSTDYARMSLQILQASRMRQTFP